MKMRRALGKQSQAVFSETVRRPVLGRGRQMRLVIVGSRCEIISGLLSAKHLACRRYFYWRGRDDSNMKMRRASKNTSRCRP